jgi:DNA-binding XRE family transcriptional regulator
MENIIEINTLEAQIVIIDERLNPYKNKILFPEKVKKAKEILKISGLPNEVFLNAELNFSKQQADLNQLGALIKQTRLQRHLSEEDLAALLGVENTVIFRIENNDTTVSMETILQVFHVLDAKLSFVVTLQQ